MWESLTASLSTVIEQSVWLGPLAALIAGMLTAANPCVLVMIPLMVGYVAGQDGAGPRRSLLLSLTFVLGLSVMLAVLFLATWGASSVLRAEWWTYVAAAVCLLMGLHLVGVLTWTIPAPTGLTPKRKGYIGALLLGLLFGLVSLPCAGPMLLAVLAVAPVRGPVFGLLLLVAYGVGHCGLILVGGTSVGFVQRLADSRGWQRGLAAMRYVAGGVILMVGIVLLVS